MNNTVFSPHRVAAMVLRYVYVLRSSWPRLLELTYWPTVQMVLWGFISQFMAANSTWVAQATGVFLAAVLLWEVLFRGQLGVSLPFFEEMYSRNLGHLFVTPLRPYELICALTVISLIRTCIGEGMASLLAILFYHYSIFDLGLPLVAFLPTCWSWDGRLDYWWHRWSCAMAWGRRVWPGWRFSPLRP
ncbi:membrane hypothetical protein [Gammaproteobacteria bacterium]